MKRNHLLSQHFLTSPARVLELIGHTNIRKNDTVLDIGAGSGIISDCLSKRCKHVIAIEPDPETFALLSRNLSHKTSVSLRQANALTMPLPSEPYKIFANIPFHLSSDIVRRFCFSDHPPKSMNIIVQKQFARKLTLGTGHFQSQLSICLGPWYMARIRCPLRKTDYFPHPNVDTVLLELKPRKTPLLAHDHQAVFHAFVQKYYEDYPRFQKHIDASIAPSHLPLERWVSSFLGE